jgi:hypothetical protein
LGPIDNKGSSLFEMAPVKDKPAESQVLQYLPGLIFLLVMIGSLWGLWTAGLHVMHSGDEANRFVLWIYREAAVSTHAPTLLRDCRSLPLVYWICNYIAIAFLAGLLSSILARILLAVFLVAPKRSLVEDPLYLIQHYGIDTPPLRHLDDLLYVCPSADTETLLRNMKIARISPVAPPARGLDIKEAPSVDQIDAARKRYAPS